MFTGIVTDLGAVRSVQGQGDIRLEFHTGYDMGGVPAGASICCSGICLTVVDKGADWFAVSVSAETLARTTIGDWSEGTLVNLERALKVGDELGGHIVSGHVDGVARIVSITRENNSRRFEFKVPGALRRFIAKKGSVALDGVSLTVNEVAGNQFGVNLIPHTLAATTLGAARPGDRVNLEVDMLARYVARLLELE
jgi:riboflavin synthase